jgi:large-conductance mechanosensitive channel
MDGIRSDDTPRGFLDELRSAFWNRRAGQIALAVLLAQSALRLVSGLVAYLIVPFIASFVNSNSESVLFSSKPPFRWEPLSYLILEFVLVLIIFFYVGRALRPKRLRSNEAEEIEIDEQQPAASVGQQVAAADSEESESYTITGEQVNPAQIGTETK